MEWVEKNVRSDLRQESTSKSEREGVQGGRETSNVVRVGDSGTDEKTGGGDGGGRVEDIAIFIRNDKNGQDQEWVHQRDSTGGTVWRENTRGKTEVVWTPEERWWVYWEKDAEDGVARKAETRNAKRRFMDAVKEDMAEVEVTEEDTEDRNNWRWEIRCGDPWWEKPKEDDIQIASKKVHRRCQEQPTIIWSPIPLLQKHKLWDNDKSMDRFWIDPQLLL